MHGSFASLIYLRIHEMHIMISVTMCVFFFFFFERKKKRTEYRSNSNNLVDFRFDMFCRKINQGKRLLATSPSQIHDKGKLGKHPTISKLFG